MAAAVQSIKESPASSSALRAPSPGPPPSPPASPYCVELPQDVVEKIAELDLELSEGDITQKGYEKKKNKLLAPFLRENQPTTATSVSNGNNKPKEDVVRNGDSKQSGPVKQSSTTSSSQSTPAASISTPSAPPAESSLTTSGTTSGLSDSSGQWKIFDSGH